MDKRDRLCRLVVPAFSSSLNYVAPLRYFFGGFSCRRRVGFGSLWLVQGLNLSMQRASMSQCGSAMVSVSSARKQKRLRKLA